MHFTNVLSVALLSAIPAVTAKYVWRDEQAHTLSPREENPNNTTTVCDWNEPKITIAQAMANWMAVWAGNHSEWLVNHTITPDMQLHTDRLPNGENDNATTVAQEIHTSKDMLAYMNRSGTGFTQYDFVGHFRFANPDGSMYIIRWGLEAIVSADNPSE